MFYGIVAALSAIVFLITYVVYSKKFEYTKVKNAVVSLCWSFYSVMAVYMFVAGDLLEKFLKDF